MTMYASVPQEAGQIRQFQRRSENEMLEIFKDDEEGSPSLQLAPRFQRCQDFLHAIRAVEEEERRSAVPRNLNRAWFVWNPWISVLSFPLSLFLGNVFVGFLITYLIYLIVRCAYLCCCVGCITSIHQSWRARHPRVILYDKDVALLAVQSSSNFSGSTLKYMSTDLQDERDVVLAAVMHHGCSLQYASQRLKEDKAIVLEALKQDGNCLRFLSDEIRSNKEWVLTAVSQSPESLKYAMGGLNQDSECLIAAGIWDEEYGAEPNVGTPPKAGSQERKKIVLSTRFSLGTESSPTATSFTVALKNHYFIRDEDFEVYSPNAFNKQTCDPKWTRWTWPCRGTPGTCRMDDSLKTGPPTDTCCWRYSFRYQLEHAKRVNGFMLQIIELQSIKSSKANHVLQAGKGQQIESHMASSVGVKVFRICQPAHRAGVKLVKKDFALRDIDKLVEKIEDWYKGGCSDMTEVDIRCGDVELSFVD